MYPALHATHVADEVAPVADDAVPALHCMQLDAPANDHVPCPHVVHVPAVVAPTAADAVPALHVLHVDWPV